MDFFALVSKLNASQDLRAACREFDSSLESREDRVVLLSKWMRAAKAVSPVLGDLLRVCAAQLFSNAAGECNFGSLTRFLGTMRLKSGCKLLAAQLLASKAQAWAQFSDPKLENKKDKKVGGMDAFVVKKNNPR